MKKSKHFTEAKKLLALGMVLAFMCMATACTNNKTDNDSGSMAESSLPSGTDSSAADTNDGSAAEDVGNTVTDVIDDAADGISDMADDIFGDDDNIGENGEGTTD